MKLKQRILAMLLAASLAASLVTTGAFATSFNPVVDTVTSSQDSRIDSLLSAVAQQSFSSPSESKVESMISYFINDSKYKAMGGESWPYTNDAIWTSCTDGNYTVSGINGSGCFAYAKFVMNVIYGKTGEFLKEGEPAGAVTAKGLESFLRSYAQAGEQLRLGNIHSAVFVACDKNGFYYLDTWSAYRVTLHYTTFATFADACNKVTSSVELGLYNANTNVNSSEGGSQTEPEEGDTDPVEEETMVSISPVRYPAGQMIQGSYCNLTGTVTSSAAITSFVGTIYDLEGNVIQTKETSSNSGSINIADSVINDLSFGRLPAGKYFLQYEATDANGNRAVWSSDTFTITQAVSTLTITPEDYPTGTFTPQSYDLTGTVKSNYKITSVAGYIDNENGDTLYTATILNINATEFNIMNSGIDNALKFGELEAGNYYLIYNATDASGNSVTWTSPVITVPEGEGATPSTPTETTPAETTPAETTPAETTPAETTPAETTPAETTPTETTPAETTPVETTPAETEEPVYSDDITIQPDDYPTGNVKAEPFTLTGTISTTGTALATVTGTILRANGTVVQTVECQVTTPTVAIEDTDLDAELKFSSLEAGYYQLQYTATDVDGKQNVWTSPAFAVAGKTLFTDVTKPSAWYYSFVYTMADQGMLSGYPESNGTYTFRPDVTISRAEAVAILYQVYCAQHGTPDLTDLTVPFSDVKSGAWYETMVTWAYNFGVIAGTSDTTFDPDATLTREQFAVIMRSYAEKNGHEVTDTIDLSASFSDVSQISSYALESMAWANAVGLMNGMGDGTISPKTGASRAQCATVLYALMSNGLA